MRKRSSQIIILTILLLVTNCFFLSNIQSVQSNELRTNDFTENFNFIVYGDSQSDVYTGDVSAIHDEIITAYLAKIQNLLFMWGI